MIVSQVASAGLIGRSGPIWTAPAGRVHPLPLPGFGHIKGFWKTLKPTPVSALPKRKPERAGGACCTAEFRSGLPRGLRQHLVIRYSTWPLAIMPSADQVPVNWHAFDHAVAQVGCPDRRIARLCITCCSLLPTVHITPDARRDLFHAASATGSL